MEVNSIQNYHKHTCCSNIYTPDSPATYEQYAKRAVELGHKMDYPDDDTIRQRFAEQGVIPADEVEKAMRNTDLICDFEDYQSEVFETNRKLPSIYPDKTPEEKFKIYNHLISRKFKEYMKHIPMEDYQRYYDGVKMEVYTYKDTGMIDYPLMDYEIVKRGIQYGGIITNTDRPHRTRMDECSFARRCRGNHRPYSSYGWH